MFSMKRFVFGENWYMLAVYSKASYQLT